MFGKSSRYKDVGTTTTTDLAGRSVEAVKLRRLPLVAGVPTRVMTADQLDMMSQRLYRDGTRYFHIADANTELEASVLVENEGHVILVPRR